MVIKLYVSNTSGNTKMKYHQKLIRQILEGKKIDYVCIDVGDPHHEQEKLFMQQTLKLNDDDMKALPPQLFNEKEFRGDFEKFHQAVETEQLFEQLNLEIPQDEVEYLIKHAPKPPPVLTSMVVQTSSNA